MSWQRIDQNTYIDDSLVTCAEYQLFIDEMREQGKYYQPDHWISYQYPKGQAREPVLGVRHSDAAVFCEWLRMRETNSWKYRLPMQKEVAEYTVKTQNQTPLGYWLIDEYQFTWIDNIPKDARWITIALAAALDKTRTGSWDINIAYYNACNRAIDRAIARAISLDRVRDLDFALLRDLDDVRNPDTTRPINLDMILDFILAHVHGNSSTRDFALDIYLDIVTIQERIAGRSPAFEGIRLVKEWIR